MNNSKNIFLVMLILLALAACSTKSWQDASQRYADWASGKDTNKAVKEITNYKQSIIDEYDVFIFKKRLDIYERLNEAAHKLWKSPKNVLVKKKSLDMDGETVTVVLSNRDFDNQPDMFAFLSEKGSDPQDFGFIFDLNRDGKADYLVFNGGIVFSRQQELYWMNYHWIDSNYDGRIDIKVNNAVTMDSEVKLPQKGITAWVYDSDFNGYIDKAEYLGAVLTKPLPKKDGVITVNWLLQDKVIGETTWPTGNVLEYINAAMQ